MRSILVGLVAFYGTAFSFKSTDAGDDCQEITCEDLSTDCKDKGTHGYLQDSRKVSCSVLSAYTDSHIPRPTSESETAVPPKSLKVDCHNSSFSTKRRYKPVLSISWDYEERFISSGSTLGFFLTINRFAYNILITIEDRDKNNRDDTEVPQYVRFKYNCFGMQFATLEKRKRLHLRIASIPLSKFNDSTNRLSVSYKVPTAKQCQSSTVSKPPSCSWNTTKHAETGSHANPAERSNIMLLLVAMTVGFTIFVSAVAAFIQRSTKKKIQEKDPQDGKRPECPSDREKNILVLVDRTRKRDCEKAHKLVAKLRVKIKDSDLNIVCSWESSQDILRQPVEWYKRSIKDAFVVIFINAVEEMKYLNERSSERTEFLNAVTYYFNTFNSTAKETIFLAHSREDIDRLKRIDATEHCKMFFFKEEYSKDEDFCKHFHYLTTGNGEKKHRSRPR